MGKLDKEKFLEEVRTIEDEEDDVEYLIKTIEIIFGYVYSEETTKNVVENLRKMMFKRKQLKKFKEIKEESLEKNKKCIKENSKKACQIKKNMVK